MTDYDESIRLAESLEESLKQIRADHLRKRLGTARYMETIETQNKPVTDAINKTFKQGEDIKGFLANMALSLEDGKISSAEANELLGRIDKNTFENTRKLENAKDEIANILKSSNMSRRDQTRNITRILNEVQDTNTDRFLNIDTGLEKANYRLGDINNRLAGVNQQLFDADTLLSGIYDNTAENNNDLSDDTLKAIEDNNKIINNAMMEIGKLKEEKKLSEENATKLIKSIAELENKLNNSLEVNKLGIDSVTQIVVETGNKIDTISKNVNNLNENSAVKNFTEDINTIKSELTSLSNRPIISMEDLKGEINSLSTANNQNIKSISENIEKVIENMPSDSIEQMKTILEEFKKQTEKNVSDEVDVELKKLTKMISDKLTVEQKIQEDMETLLSRETVTIDQVKDEMNKLLTSPISQISSISDNIKELIKNINLSSENQTKLMEKLKEILDKSDESELKQSNINNEVLKIAELIAEKNKADEASSNVPEITDRFDRLDDTITETPTPVTRRRVPPPEFESAILSAEKKEFRKLNEYFKQDNVFRKNPSTPETFKGNLDALKRTKPTRNNEGIIGKMLENIEKAKEYALNNISDDPKVKMAYDEALAKKINTDINDLINVFQNLEGSYSTDIRDKTVEKLKEMKLPINDTGLTPQVKNLRISDSNNNIDDVKKNDPEEEEKVISTKGKKSQTGVVKSKDQVSKGYTTIDNYNPTNKKMKGLWISSGGNLISPDENYYMNIDSLQDGIVNVKDSKNKPVYKVLIENDTVSDLLHLLMDPKTKHLNKLNPKSKKIYSDITNKLNQPKMKNNRGKSLNEKIPMTFYYNNPQQLVERLTLLISARQAGNNSPLIVSQIRQVNDELLKVGQIDKNQHAVIFEKYALFPKEMKLGRPKKNK